MRNVIRLEGDEKRTLRTQFWKNRKEYADEHFEVFKNTHFDTFQERDAEAKRLNVDFDYGLVDDCLLGHVHFYNPKHRLRSCR
jgi:hypothetical protein